MREIIFSKKAVEDFTGIWNYTFDTWSERQADKYYELLIDFCRRLADNPNLGKVYPEIADNIMDYKAGQHIIFYQDTSDKEIVILRVLHARMDLKSRMED